jgi:hypothetical protein
MGEERLRIPVIVMDKVFMPGIKVKITVNRFAEQNLGRKFVGILGSKENGEPYKVGTLCQIISSRPLLSVSLRSFRSMSGGPVSFNDESRELVLVGVDRFRILNLNQEEGM